MFLVTFSIQKQKHACFLNNRVVGHIPTTARPLNNFASFYLSQPKVTIIASTTTSTMSDSSTVQYRQYTVVLICTTKNLNKINAQCTTTSYQYQLTMMIHSQQPVLVLVLSAIRVVSVSVLSAAMAYDTIVAHLSKSCFMLYILSTSQLVVDSTSTSQCVLRTTTAQYARRPSQQYQQCVVVVARYKYYY